MIRRLSTLHATRNFKVVLFSSTSMLLKDLITLDFSSAL